MLALFALLVSAVSAQDLSYHVGLFVPEQADWLEPIRPIESFGGGLEANETFGFGLEANETFGFGLEANETFGFGLEANETDCEGFPWSGEFSEELLAFADDILMGLLLSDPHRLNPERTNGDMYCQFLASQIEGDNKMINGTNLVMYGRINGCGEVSGEWNLEREFGRHDEILCCNSKGKWVESCPEIDYFDY